MKKGQIRVLLEETNMTQMQIAQKLKVSRATIAAVAVRLKAGQALSPSRKGACGRKRLSSQRADRKLVQLCVNNRRAPSEVLRQQWLAYGVTSSARTVRRRLWDAGLKSRHPRKKPLLTPAMKQKRLEWANRYSSWTSDNWSKVVFSDESSLHILDDRTTRIRRRQGEEYNEDCIIRTVKHPLSVMVWGAISVRGTSRLHIVEGTMRKEQYIQVLDKKLLLH